MLNKSTIGTRVKLYRNLNNGMIGVRDARTNLVLGYCLTASLVDVTANVQRGARETIVRKFAETGRREKNVHAFLIGTLADFTITAPAPTDADLPAIPDARRVSYNPYTAANFFHLDDASPFHSAPLVTLSTSGKGTPMTVEARTP